MNSKGEYNLCTVPRITLDGVDESGEGGDGYEVSTGGVIVLDKPKKNSVKYKRGMWEWGLGGELVKTSQMTLS